VRKPGMLDGVEHLHDLLPHMVASGIRWQDEKEEGTRVRGMAQGLSLVFSLAEWSKLFTYSR